MFGSNYIHCAPDKNSTISGHNELYYMNVVNEAKIQSKDRVRFTKMEREDFNRHMKEVCDKVAPIVGDGFVYNPLCRRILTYRKYDTDVVLYNGRHFFMPRSELYSKITDAFDID
jgi:hypothetical protein